MLRNKQKAQKIIKAAAVLMILGMLAFTVSSLFS